MNHSTFSRRRGLLVGVTVLFCSVSTGARAAPTSKDDRVYRSYLDFGSLVKGGRVAPNWLPDGSSFWYVKGGPNDRQILEVDPATGAERPLFDVQRLRAILRESAGYEAAGAGVPFDRLQFLAPRKVAFVLDGVSYELDLQTYALARPLPPSTYSIGLVPSEAERAVPGTFMRERFIGLGLMQSPAAVSHDERWIAGIENQNLVLRSTLDGQKVRITRDGTPVAFWDVEATLWNPWSPDGQYLAVYKQDARGMARIPNIHWLTPLEGADEVIVIPAGGKLYRSELYLVDMYLRQPVKVDLGDTENQYLRILSWLPDSSELLLARYDRLLTRVDIQAVNATTRAVRTLFTERSKTFLTNQHEAIWNEEKGFTLLPDGSGFIWNSERSDWDHLYYYDIRGRLIRQLTSGAWRVKDVVRIDLSGGWVYFTGHGDQARPYDTHFYRVGLDGRHLTQLTRGKGQHAVNLAPAAKYFTDTFSAVDEPPKTVLRKADGTLVRTLGESDISRLRSVGYVAPKEYVVKAADGTTDLWATLYFPYNFDTNQKYPVVEYIYAGPQTTTRPMDFCDDLPYRWQHFNRALANLGFIVVTLDARGTPGRSKAFHDTVYRNWGQFEIADHAGALRQLGARLGFLDLDRVGIWGASWGGQFAFRALTQAPDLYKAGISQVPGFEPWRGSLYEIYLGLPNQNKALYEAADTFQLAPKLRGDLLLLGSMNDTATQASLFKMSETLIRLGKQHEVMVFPNASHAVMGKTSEYDLELKKRFFVRYLMYELTPRAP